MATSSSGGVKDISVISRFIRDNSSNTVTAPSPKDTRPLYTIQVGAFEKPAAAEALVARLKMRYDAVFVDPLTGARPVYRVRVGRLANLRAAGELERQLRTEGFQPFIVPPSQLR